MDWTTFEKRTGLYEADFALLNRVPLLSKLDRAVAMDLLSDSSTRHFPRGTMVFLQDDPADRFFVVLDGWVKLFRQISDGQQSVLHVMGPGDSFAEAAIFDSHVFPVSAEVVADSRLLSIPGDSFVARLRRDTDICFAIMGAMSRHNRFLVRAIEQMTVKSSTERLAMFLNGLCSGDEPSCKITLPLDKGLIAGRLNMQPETLSRGFAKLRAIGVETKGGRVFVKDKEKLARIAHGEDG